MWNYSVWLIWDLKYQLAVFIPNVLSKFQFSPDYCQEFQLSETSGSGDCANTPLYSYFTLLWDSVFNIVLTFHPQISEG